VRAGFVLKKPEETQGVWEVATVHEKGTAATTDGENQVQMVAIRMEIKETSEDSTELAALQWVARHAATMEGEESTLHVQNSVLAAADSTCVYTVSPYDYAVSPSLFEYCSAQPGAIIPEETARGFFRQIIKVSLDWRLYFIPERAWNDKLVFVKGTTLKGAPCSLTLSFLLTITKGASHLGEHAIVSPQPFLGKRRLATLETT
jgi:hypothetical protein